MHPSTMRAVVFYRGLAHTSYNNQISSRIFDHAEAPRSSQEHHVIRCPAAWGRYAVRETTSRCLGSGRFPSSVLPYGTWLSLNWFLVYNLIQQTLSSCILLISRGSSYISYLRDPYVVPLIVRTLLHLRSSLLPAAPLPEPLAQSYPTSAQSSCPTHYIILFDHPFF